MPNYVPAEMVTPTRVAISALTAGNPFIDPTTSTTDIVSPNESTQGAATKPADPNAPVTNQNITVTVEMPEDDTISQTEYEESNNKFFQQFADATTTFQSDTDSILEKAANDDSDFIDSLTSDVANASGIPDFPSISGLWSPNGGSCVAYHSEATIAGNTRTITYDKHCPTYNSVVHPLLVWFLYISTALYVIHLAGRTFKSTVS